MNERPIALSRLSRYPKLTKHRHAAASKSPFMTTIEVAEYLHTYPMQVYKLVREGKLSALKVGKDYRFYKNEIGQFARNGN